MEEQFQYQPPSLLVGGEAPSAAADDAYYSGVCAGLSFRSLLTADSFESAAGFPRNLLKMPKSEPLFAVDDGVHALAPPYNFFSESTCSSHHQLPKLLSYEPPHSTVAVDFPMLNARSGTASYGKKPRRRQASKMSDKTRCLEKLLPSGRKMDMATVLEEAHKYIKFLQAQVSVLQSMPRESAAAAYFNGASSGGGGDLGRLSRQQLLQVVMNSPAAQTQFYSNGCCVYSVEQLLLLKKKADMEAVRCQMMPGSANPVIPWNGDFGKP